MINANANTNLHCMAWTNECWSHYFVQFFFTHANEWIHLLDHSYHNICHSNLIPPAIFLSEWIQLCNSQWTVTLCNYDRYYYRVFVWIAQLSSTQHICGAILSFVHSVCFFVLRKCEFGNGETIFECWMHT